MAATDTKLLARVGTTPLHRSAGLVIHQSDAMNEMIRNVCVAEYAARNFQDVTVLEAALKSTGLDYSALFAPLHRAVNAVKEDKNLEPAKLLMRVLLHNDNKELNAFETLASSKSLLAELSGEAVEHQSQTLQTQTYMDAAEIATKRNRELILKEEG